MTAPAWQQWQPHQAPQTWNTPASEPEDERPLKELIQDLTQSGQDLVRNEIALAKAELKDQAKMAGKGAALLSGGAVVGLLTLFLLSFAAAWGLAEFLPVWAGFLIMGVIYAAVAGGLLMAGKKRLADVRPAPVQTLETLKRDVQTAKSSLTRGMHA